MATTATESQGKTSFVKEFLHDNPQANTKAVNEAWQAAGFDGTISPTLVNKTRVKLTGNLRGNSKTAAKEESAPRMPKTAPATLGKTGFVKEFLHDNPQANTKAVNEAWATAGMKGTISHPIISQVRKQLGLTGNLRGKTRNAAKEKAASNMPGTATVTPVKTSFVNKTRAKMNLTGNLGGNSKTAAKEKSAPRLPKTATATPGKTSFLKEFLHDNPQGNVKAVNEAWKAAGFDGTISTALVYKARASLGLTGNLSGKTKKTKGKATSTGKKLGRPRNTAMVNLQPRGRKSARTLALTELEADIDRLIFKVMGVGDLTEIEDSLRQARRLLYVIANGR